MPRRICVQIVLKCQFQETQPHLQADVCYLASLKTNAHLPLSGCTYRAVRVSTVEPKAFEVRTLREPKASPMPPCLSLQSSRQATPGNSSPVTHPSGFLAPSRPLLLGLFTFSFTLLDSPTSIPSASSGTQLKCPLLWEPFSVREDDPIISYQNTSTTCNYFIYFIYIAIPDRNTWRARTMCVLATRVSLQPLCMLVQ